MAHDKPREDEPDEKRPAPDPGVEITRIREREKTIRYVATVAGITIGLGIVTYGIVKTLDKPPWVQALAIVLVSAPGPTPVIYRLIVSRFKYVRKTHTRTVDLERKIDSKRESSEPGENAEP